MGEDYWNKVEGRRNLIIVMANLSEQGGEKMTNGNENGNHKNDAETSENKRLRKLLQKAVNTENAPNSLRDKIRKMIREK